MVPDAVRSYRADYRARNIGPRYRGPAHLLFTSLVTLSAIALLCSRLHAVTATQWLAIPVTFLIGNLIEYLSHRGPMHTKPAIDLFMNRLLFQRHTLEHHRFYTAESMPAESTADWRIVLFPPFAVVGLLLVLLPFYLLLRIASPNVALLFYATGIAYFLSYEWLHLAYHLPTNNAPSTKRGLLATLRNHHLAHHDPNLMKRYNFNITFPIADLLFGTLHQGSRPD